ncbi:MAG: Uma2 family endonuclease [Limnoraphis sp. WC205]|jgi:Uma2 family endonuclease|nr:Uma2 family endonuclease [Limnoraphis sp. WC205]
MNTTTKQKLTFEEYLNYDDGTDNRYELQDGELIIVNPATFRHAFIIRFLTNIFEGQINQLSQPWITLSGIGVRTSLNRSRIPYLCVIDREEIDEYTDYLPRPLVFPKGYPQDDVAYSYL